MGESQRDLLLTYQNELTKEYIELDGQGRTWKVYQANTDAANGEKCILTQFAYPNLTSTTITKRKESYSTWNSAWDL